MKSALQKADFIPREGEAAMKTWVRECRPPASLKEQYSPPAAGAGLLHGGGLWHHGGESLLPAGKPASGATLALWCGHCICRPHAPLPSLRRLMMVPLSSAPMISTTELI